MLQLISLLSFLLPTQLALYVDNPQSTVYGFRIDYLMPALYLTDIISIAIIIKWLYDYKLRTTKRHILYIAIFVVFALFNISVSDYFMSSIYKWLKMAEMIFLGIIIFTTKDFDIFKNFVKPLSYSTLIVCFLGILQFIKKGSIGGVFYWLGERSFLFNDPNIAPYPYSTFSHPNSFAGFLLVFAIFMLEFRKRFDIKYFLILTIFVGINLILTNSLNVYIAIFFLLLYTLVRKNFAFAFLMFDFSERSITHRLELMEASWQMIKNNFWFGVGLNNFIPNLVKVSSTFVNSWELQPVHNIFLLIFSEIGIFGFIIFSLLLSKLVLNTHLLAILLTGMLDHYWITLQQNMLLFTYVLAISQRIKKQNEK